MTTASLNSYSAVYQVLQINQPTATVDPYAISALEEAQAYYLDQAEAAESKILTEGLTGYVESLSQKLNQTGLDDITRLLLSNHYIYAVVIQQALEEGNVQAEDATGLYNTVLRYIGGTPRLYFLAKLLTAVLNDRRIQVKISNVQWQQLYELVMEQGISIRSGQVETSVTDLLSTLYREGDLPHYVERYINERTVLPAIAFTASIQQSMIDYLVDLGFQVQSDEAFESGEYDEYFILAYNEALKTSTVQDDPIDTARIRGGEVSWDFSVDSFETEEAQEVITDNIKAAGALDYIYVIGEQMRVFDVVNALVLRWASGQLDVPEGTTAALLYRFHKLRDERSTPEERAMLYKRVLNKGNGRLLSNMVPNTTFPRLWHQMMAEVAEYIEKSEGSDSGSLYLSRTQLYQALKDLQYNLTETMTGMAHLQVTEDYAHLQEALDILRSSEIVSEYGGRRKSIWSVIELVAKEDLRFFVPTSSLRTLAVEGNKIFQWIAGFSEGAVNEEAFQSFLNSAESWIVSQATLESDEDFQRGNGWQVRNGRMPMNAAPRNGYNGDYNGWDEDEDDLDDWEV